jgi:phospho-acceptor domain-containing protein
MVSDIAHELRTPLTSIRGWLEATPDGTLIRHLALRQRRPECFQAGEHTLISVTDIGSGIEVACTPGVLTISGKPTGLAADVVKQAPRAGHRQATRRGPPADVNAVGAPGVETILILRLPADQGT